MASLASERKWRLNIEIQEISMEIQTETIIKRNIVMSRLFLGNHAMILITAFLISRGLEEREGQEDQQEKLDQKCVKYFTDAYLHILC